MPWSRSTGMAVARFWNPVNANPDAIIPGRKYCLNVRTAPAGGALGRDVLAPDQRREEQQEEEREEEDEDEGVTLAEEDAGLRHDAAPHDGPVGGPRCGERAHDVSFESWPTSSR